MAIHDEMIGQYVIVRASAAGVHAGLLDAVEGDQVRLRHSRRLWRWRAVLGISLSDLSVHGLSDDGSVIAEEVEVIVIRDWCELLPCSPAARESIAYAEVADV